MIAKYFATSFAIEKVVERSAGDEQLLADSDDLNELGGIAVEVDHVPGFLRRHGAGVHGHAHVGLGQRRSVVGAVAGHRDEAALSLFLLDVLEFVFRCRLRQEVVDAGFLSDGRGGERIVTGDHYGADAHGPQRREPLLHPALHDVLQVNDAEHLLAICHGERSAAVS